MSITHLRRVTNGQRRILMSGWIQARQECLIDKHSESIQLYRRDCLTRRNLSCQINCGIPCAARTHSQRLGLASFLAALFHVQVTGRRRVNRIVMQKHASSPKRNTLSTTLAFDKSHHENLYYMFDLLFVGNGRHSRSRRAS